MKRIIIYSSLVVAVMMSTTIVRAEIQGLQSEAECIKPYVEKVSDLSKMLKDLSAQTPKSQILSPPYYTDYFDSKNGRYIFCMDKTKAAATITTPTTFTNNSVYPVIIYNLRIDSLQAPLNQTLLTVQPGTGEIALQSLNTLDPNGNIVGLKSPILLQGKSTLLSSTVSCDAANTTPAITVSSDKNTFRKVAINECALGLEVAGSYNIFSEVAVQKTVTEGGDSSLGGTAVSSNGDFNHFLKMTLAGYKYGVKVNGNYIKIASSTLDGALGAVVIGHNAATNAAYSPVTASQNTYTTVNTITYADTADAKANTLLSVEWMGKHVPDGKDYADRIVGKLLDQTNTSQSVELFDYGEKKGDVYNLQYLLKCTINQAVEKIPITFKQKDGTKEIKEISQGEKFFDCLTGPDGKSALKISTLWSVRFLSNTPTVSVMTDDVTLADLGDIVVITPAGAFTPETTGLAGAGGDSLPAAQNDTGGGAQVAMLEGGGLGGTTPSSGLPSGETLIVDEAQKEDSGSGSGSGSAAAMTPGGVQLEAAPAAAGPSAGGCSLLKDSGPLTLALSHMGRGEFYGVMFWWLLPVVSLWYGRKKDDDRGRSL